MDQKGQDDEGGQQRGQIPFAMTLVVLKMVAFSFQDVVVFVLNLPATASGRDDFGHLVVVERQRSRKGVTVQDLATDVGGGEFAPVHRQGIIRVAQGDRLGVTVGIRLVASAVPACAAHDADGAVALQVIEPFVDEGMGIGFAD